MDIIPASLYKITTINSPIIVENGINSLKFTDLTLLICTIVPTIYYFLFTKQITRKNKKSISFILLFVFIFFQTITLLGSFRRQKIYSPPHNFVEHFENVFPNHFTNWLFWYLNHNFIGYTVKILIDADKSKIKLTDEEVTKIKNHIAYKLDVHSNSVLIQEGKTPSNLIFVVVESLPYKIIEMEDSTITPTLCKLINDSNAFVTRCKVLTGYGRSSDAQLMYNTGLLPMRTEPWVMRYAHNNYPSLAKALNKESIEVIGENGILWSHNVTTQSFGFSKFISNIADNRLDADSIIFNSATTEISMQTNEFYLFITTLSMHDPYDSKKLSYYELLKYPSNFTTSYDVEYLARLHYFDKHLGIFLSNLKEYGVLDNSLIIIIGDHEIRSTCISPELQDEFVPFIIINTPKTLYNTYPVTQLDVFSTILDLMDADYNYLGVEYHGLGNSLTNKSQTHKLTPSDYDISEKIIRANNL